jgi:hypothetical protein
MARLPAKDGVHLVAFGRMGPCALLARALAGDNVRRAAIDLDGFDFDQIKTPDDEMMLPGALKYGGIHGFTPLCVHGESRLFHAPAGENLVANERVSLEPGETTPDKLVEWIVR